MAKETPKTERDISQAERDLLKEIREDYRHFLDYWRTNRDEMSMDMRFASGHAFTPDEEARRRALDRPCETPDELSQYVKQTNNNLRQSKRDAKITPASEDANQDDAEKRESVLRGLNHRGNFQAAFQTAFEQCTWCSQGVFGISIKYTDSSKQHSEPRPRRIANQFSALLDPYAKEADYSDQEKAFIVDRIRKSNFTRLYPNAQKRSFGPEDSKIAPDWILGEELIIAEAWRKASELDTKFDSSIKEGEIIQYMTNGIEILDTVHWPGSWIPVIPILGEELYVEEEGNSKRMYLSQIRRARVAQKMLAFIASGEIEEFGQAPRTKYIGYDGQFTSPDWETINVDPKAYISVPILADPTDPTKVLPLPTLVQFNPHAQEYETAGEVWRRRVQAGIGVMPLPTQALRQNEKSGIALEKIQNQEAVGSYHFTDNADRALVNYARQMNELITKVMVNPRQVGVKLKDDSHSLMHIVSGDHPEPDGAKPEEILHVDQGEYDVTILTGPSYQSEREEQSSFVDTLLQNLQTLPIPPPIATKILALAIRMKNLGHLGDQIAKMLDPEQGDPQAQLQGAQAQAAQMQQAMGEMGAELQKLKLEKQGKVVDNEYNLKLEQLKQNFEVWKVQVTLDNARAIAEIQTKAQIAIERTRQIQEVETELHSAAHEAAMSAQEHGQTLEQGQQAAALAPQPDQNSNGGEE